MRSAFVPVRDFPPTLGVLWAHFRRSEDWLGRGWTLKDVPPP
jgi:hypothetical protein